MYGEVLAEEFVERYRRLARHSVEHGFLKVLVAVDGMDAVCHNQGRRFYPGAREIAALVIVAADGAVEIDPIVDAQHGGCEMWLIGAPENRVAVAGDALKVPIVLRSYDQT